MVTSGCGSPALDKACLSEFPSCQHQLLLPHALIFIKVSDPYLAVAKVEELREKYGLTQVNLTLSLVIYFSHSRKILSKEHGIFNVLRENKNKTTPQWWLDYQETQKQD